MKHRVQPTAPVKDRPPMLPAVRWVASIGLAAFAAFGLLTLFGAVSAALFCLGVFYLALIAAVPLLMYAAVQMIRARVSRKSSA